MNASDDLPLPLSPVMTTSRTMRLQARAQVGQKAKVREHAKTQGGMVSALYGSTEQGTASLRYGGSFSPKSAWRVFAKHRRVDDLHDMDGRKFRGALESNYAGFRTDSEPDGRSRFTLQGGAAVSRTRDTILRPDLGVASMAEYSVPNDMEDVALQASWSRSLGGAASVSLQGFLSHFHIDTSDVRGRSPGGHPFGVEGARAADREERCDEPEADDDRHFLPTGTTDRKSVV